MNKNTNSWVEKDGKRGVFIGGVFTPFDQRKKFVVGSRIFDTEDAAKKFERKHGIKDCDCESKGVTLQDHVGCATTPAHTSGPWMYGKLSGEITNNKGVPICGFSDEDNEFENVAANAPLIAAAPDLKRALGYAFDFLSKVKDGSFDPRDVDGLQHTILQAL